MGNGRSPEGLTLEAVRERGVKGGALPPFHALTVTVPGAAAAWEDAVRQWGNLSLEQARLCKSCAFGFAMHLGPHDNGTAASACD